MSTLIEWYETIKDISFWIEFIENFRDLGPLAPIFLAFIESVIPALPLIVIVSFNVTAYGPFLGFIYSWIGSFLGSVFMFMLYRKGIQQLFQKWSANKKNLSRIVEYVDRHSWNVLFMLTSLPFTPSSLINLVYGLSNIDARFFIRTIFFSKALMIASLSLFGHSLTQITTNPFYLILTVIALFILYLISKKISKRYLEKQSAYLRNMPLFLYRKCFQCGKLIDTHSQSALHMIYYQCYLQGGPLCENYFI